MSEKENSNKIENEGHYPIQSDLTLPNLNVFLQGKSISRMWRVCNFRNVWLRQLGVVGDFDTALPLLLPGVGHDPVVVGSQRFTVRKLHRADQVSPNLERNTIYH